MIGTCKVKKKEKEKRKHYQTKASKNAIEFILYWSSATRPGGLILRAFMPSGTPLGKIRFSFMNSY